MKSMGDVMGRGWEGVGGGALGDIILCFFLWGLKNHVTSHLPYPQEFNEMK